MKCKEAIQALEGLSVHQLCKKARKDFFVVARIDKDKDISCSDFTLIWMLHSRKKENRISSN